MKKTMKILLALATAALLGSSAQAAVSFNPSPVTVVVGGTATVTATGGTSDNSGYTGKWTTSFNPTGKATASATRTGSKTATITFTGSSAGSTTCTVTHQFKSSGSGRTETGTITVNVIQPTEVSLCVGDTAQFYFYNTSKKSWTTSLNDTAFTATTAQSGNGVTVTRSVAGLATNGRCPTTIFEIPANEASQYDDGAFALYLLDTRVRNEDGSVGVAMAGRFSKFPPNAVNAVLVVPKDNQAAKVAAGGGSVTGDAVEMSKASIDVHTQIQPPKITAIIPNGANVVLKVEGLEPTADYFVVSGSSPTEFDMTKKAQVKDSQGELKVHQSGVAEFYKIIGVRKFN